MTGFDWHLLFCWSSVPFSQIGCCNTKNWELVCTNHRNKFTAKQFHSTQKIIRVGDIYRDACAIIAWDQNLRWKTPVVNAHCLYILERRKTVDSTASSAQVSVLIISDPLLPSWFIAAPQPAGYHHLALFSDSNGNHTYINTYIIHLINFSLILNYPIHHIC